MIRFDSETQAYLRDEIINGPDQCYPTGVEVVDYLLGIDGLTQGDLVLLSAPTGVGKTTLLCIMMMSMAGLYPNDKFLFIGTEQTEKEIYSKLLSIENHISINELRKGHINNFKEIGDNIYFQYFENDKFDVIDCIEKAHDEGFKFVFYDYLGAILDATNDKEWAALEMQADALKRLANKTDMIIFTATQTSNNIEELEKEPKIYNQRFLANSKGIARKCSVCFILARNIGKDSNDFNVTLDLYKNRHGEAPKRVKFKLDYEFGEISWLITK